MIQHISKKMFVTVPLVLLLAVAAIGQAGNAKAWDEGGFGPGHWGYFHHFWFHHWGCGDSCGVDQGQSIVNPCCDNQPDQGVCCYYNQGAGDVQNNLAYSPVGQCAACGEGYPHQTDQTAKQGTSINVVNSPGATVSTNPESNQQLQPLQHLVQRLCTITGVNCAQAQQEGP